MMCDVKLTPAPTNPAYGDLIPAEQWLASVEWGYFIPYDGDGYWATKEGYDNDSNVWDLNKPAWATHVLWLNR